MQILVLRPFSCPLGGGMQTFLPGIVLSDQDYTAAQWASILEASGGYSIGYLNYPAPSYINDAAEECVALRLRGGDPGNETQSKLQTAVIFYNYD